MSDLLEYKCPACGGALEFDSTLQKMKCPYCDTVVEMADMQAKDEALNDDDNKTIALEQDTNMSVFVCNSCGGEIIGDENMAATECPYCGNQVVVSGRFTGSLKPDFVIPFKLDKKAAKEKYNEFIKGKFLLPKLFKHENHINEIKGIYVPFWLYDSKVKGDAMFVAENIRHWSDSKYDYTETSIYHVYREGEMAFSNIPCDGSEKMPDELMESIEPFNFSEAVPFQSAYLAGYFADKYDVDEVENAARANERTLNSTIDMLKQDFEHEYTNVKNPTNIGYNEEDIKKGIFEEPYARMSILEGTVKYALYPVWLLSTTYKGEKYTFAMNGQTGKFVGDLPVDKKKKNLTFGAVFAATGAIVTAIAYLLG